MSRLDFHIEFYTERAELSDALKAETDTRLRELADEHTDIIGASVAVEELTGEETPNFFQARVIAYVRPDNIVAIEKGGNVETALRGALDALERQIRKRRAYLRERSRPETEEGLNVGPYQLNSRELYDTYAQNVAPEELLNRTRIDIATELMTQQGLSEEEAYYATDEILTFAQESIDTEPPP